jgi:MoaA/NifB/PqqE/SkfB family radical SAM enzyme
MLQCLEKSFSTILYTNGTFPIGRCRDILRTDHIVINLGAADRESYRALQGKDLFMRVVKNIKELARLRPQINPNFRLEVVFIETSMNSENFSRTEKLVKKLGADHVRKSKFEPSEHNNHLMLDDPQEKKTSVEAWPSCYHGWFDSAIRINGDVNVCAFSKQLTIGNVLKNSFKDIWKSDEYAKARGLALTGAKPFGNSHECINCRAVFRNKEIGSKVDLYNRSQKA